jgi:hypothetical protein
MAAWKRTTSSGSKSIVLAACPSWLPPSAWEEFVLWHAEEMLEDSRFRTAHKPLSDALLEHPHDKMSGARAVEVIESALWRNLGPNEDYVLRVLHAFGPFRSLA